MVSFRKVSFRHQASLLESDYWLMIWSVRLILSEKYKEKRSCKLWWLNRNEVRTEPDSPPLTSNTDWFSPWRPTELRDEWRKLTIETSWKLLRYSSFSRTRKGKRGKDIGWFGHGDGGVFVCRGRFISIRKQSMGLSPPQVREGVDCAPIFPSLTPTCQRILLANENAFSSPPSIKE